MAKKKGGKTANGDSVEIDQPQHQEEAVVNQTDDVQQEQQEKSVEELDAEELRNELRAARIEIARLKAELANASSDRDGPLKASKPQEVHDLQEKLQVRSWYLNEGPRSDRSPSNVAIADLPQVHSVEMMQQASAGRGVLHMPASLKNHMFLQAHILVGCLLSSIVLQLSFMYLYAAAAQGTARS